MTTPETPSPFPPTTGRALLAPALAAVALHLVLLGLYLSPWRFDLSALVCAAPEVLNQPGFEAVRVSQGSGYDGMCFYLLAQHAPWEQNQHPKELVAPAARHARILYPALAWLTSAGRQERLLVVLPLLNLLAVAGLTFAGSRLALGRGLSPWWGLLLPFAVNAALPLFRDLSDLLSVTLLAFVLVAWVERWPAWLVLALGLAALLTRETNLIPLGVLGLVALVQARWGTALALVTAALLWAGWIGYVAWLYGQWPFLSSSGHFTTPLGAWLEFWGSRGRLERLRLLTLLALPALVLVALLVRSRVELGLLGVAVAGLALSVLAGQNIWVDYWSYARTLTLLPLAVWLACIHARKPGLAAVLSLAGWMGVTTALRFAALPLPPA